MPVGEPAREDRDDAITAIRAMRGPHLPPEELERLIERERLESAPR